MQASVVALLTSALVAGPPGPGASPERRLLQAKRRAMNADYAADLEALRDVRADLSSLKEAPTVGHLAHYWAGFAGWRLALNGVNRGLAREEVRTHLNAALLDFEASMRLAPDFADAHAAAASINGWLISLATDDAEGPRAYAQRSRELRARARELEPDNPRVLWVEGVSLFNTPRQFGGSPERAVEAWKRGVDASDRQRIASPLHPDWGKVECLMNLAWASLNQAEPDPGAAKKTAEAALRLRPDWYYLREVLLPRIEAGLAGAGARKEEAKP